MGADYKVTLTAKGKDLGRLGWDKEGFQIFSQEVNNKNLIRAFPSLNEENIDKAYDIYPYDVLRSRITSMEVYESYLVKQTEDSITAEHTFRNRACDYELHTLINMYPDIEFTGEVEYDGNYVESTFSSIGGTLLLTSTINQGTWCVIDSDKYFGNPQHKIIITDKELKSGKKFFECQFYNNLTGNFEVKLGKEITDYLYFRNDNQDYHYIEPNGNVTNIGEQDKNDPKLYWNMSAGKVYELLPNNKLKYLGKAKNQVEYFDVLYYQQ